ncbi:MULTISPECIES: dihydroorotate dehydrogenase [unclassified Kitasatospora]|uniref:dihydroorotate dehydrogenase n=1 Tax=unclassified Kitasatospora TaxID=2633591 RepID=UPI00070A91F7|nr:MULTISPECIES: dihydroorotate dehydrogenase [unclassified Kitasatospora]KQV22766.1 dihydroorotate oxidase [Kitasatospora sp. Root107]KRB61624.1 dihydroorotate oxidase [Kitasatospora sp. Root187]
MAPQQVDLTAPFGGRTLPNPLTTASGCAGYGRELAKFVPLDELGSVTTKTIMPYARSGRATPRMAETPSGMLNSIGLQGAGIAHFVKNELPWLAERGARVLVSIAGERLEEFAQVAEQLNGQPGVIGLEVNISCPNVVDRGLVFACNPATSYDVVRAVRRVADAELPVYAKLSPDVTSITEIAAACVQAGADGLSMINTTLGMAIDPVTMRPALAGITGGLSGPAIRPLAVRCVYQVHAEMLAGRIPQVPILAMGGLRTGLDALEFALAGASGVAVGTTLFNDPAAPLRILDELRTALAARDFTSFTDAVGYAHRPDAS